MLDQLDTDRLKVFKALSIAKAAGTTELQAGVLSKLLHFAGIDLTAVGVGNALRGATGLVSRRRVGKTVCYSLMTAGVRALDAAEDKTGDGVTVFAIDAGHVHSARRTVSAVLVEFDGVIRVSDPYFGRRTLDLLAETKATSDVRFLTMRAAGGSSQQAAMEREAAEFAKQYPHVKIRVAAANAQISHDRFVVTPAELVLVGHGFSDIGARDSYLVRIGSGAAPGLLSDSIARFDRNWGAARVVA